MIKCISNVVQRFICYLLNWLKEFEEGFKATKLSEHFEHDILWYILLLQYTVILREFLFFFEVARISFDTK